MDTNTVEQLGRRRRRRHSKDFKEMVIAECLRRDVSLAAVALRHQLNANMLRKWVLEAEHRSPGVPTTAVPVAGNGLVSSAAAFVPVGLSQPTGDAGIRVQWQRSGVTVTVVWPVSAAGDCAQWLHEILR